MLHFNYETAWRFFVFFFGLYAANIGRYLGKNLEKQDYASIAHTAVMMAIMDRDPRARQGLNSFLESGVSGAVES